MLGGSVRGFKLCSAALIVALAICLATAAANGANKKRYYTGTTLAFINSVRISGKVGSELRRCDRGASVRVLQHRSASDPTVIAELGTDVTDRQGRWSIQVSTELHDATISAEIARRVVTSAGQRVICRQGFAGATFPG
jgi:hypothetical protein